MSALAQLSDELEALVARVKPSVVGIERRRGHGTGVVLAQDGYVLTNHHVAGEGGGATVQLWDGERLEAQRVGGDAHTDLAVLRVDTKSLTAMPLADANRLAVGQLVVAVGNPFRFEQSVSVGIVSALERSLPGPKGLALEGLVQTDAAINPGNSGGPLVNMRGEIVGINTAVIPYAQGMGFAVGAKTASWVASVLIHRGEVKRRYLGVAARSSALKPGLAEQTGQPRAVHILDVQKDSPAEAAGLRADDQLLSVLGQSVGSVDDVHRVMVLHDHPSVELIVWRGDKRLTVWADTKPAQVAA